MRTLSRVLWVSVLSGLSPLAAASTESSHPATCRAVHASEQSPTPFLPCFEHEKKSVDQWMADFEKGRGKSTDALWCIYWCDERSTEVIAFLRGWMTTAREPVQRVIETILTDWSIPCEEIPYPPLRRGLIQFEARPPFQFPVPESDRSTRELLDGLYALDRRTQARAAITLVRRNEHVQAAIGAMIERYVHDPDRGFAPNGFPTKGVTVQTLDWILPYAGTETVRCLVASLTRADVSLPCKRFAMSWGVSPFPAPKKRDRAMVAALGTHALQRDDFGELAWMALLSRTGVRLPVHEDVELHSTWARQPLDDLGLETALAKALEVRLAGLVVEEEIVPAIEEAQLIALRSAIVRDRAVPWLHARLGDARPIGLAALRALCHVDVVDDEIRDRYVALLDSIVDVSPKGLSILPCLARHDARTRAALERIFRLAPDKLELLPRLAAAGFREADLGAMPRDVGKWVDAWYGQLEFSSESTWRRAHAWSFLFALGYPFAPAIHESEGTGTTALKFALALRSHREHGEDSRDLECRLVEFLRKPFDWCGAGGYNDHFEWSLHTMQQIGSPSSAFTDWAIDLLLHPDGTVTHIDEAAGLLASVDLDRLQQALLSRISLDQDSVEDEFFAHSTPFDERWSALFARQGRSSIERAPRLRELVHRRESVSMLRDLLEITRPTALDLDLLAAAIERAPAIDRELGIELVREHALDSPVLRSAVARASTDCDEFVREAAARLRSERGW